MKKIFLIADLHFGDSDMVTILDGNTESLRPFSSIEEHDEYIIDAWNKTVDVSDKVYVLGDVAQKKKDLEKFARLKGKKILIKGNHDVYELKEYAKYFKDVRATHRLTHPLCNGLLMSHIPVHPMSLNEKAHKLNIHGHIHHRIVERDKYYPTDGTKEADPRYFCVSAERIQYTPIELDVLLDIRFGSGKIGETITT
jgi:calcineurin-like phosphoesterase family protein